MAGTPASTPGKPPGEPTQVISSAILPPRSPGARKAASSKYDYVKIKVWLGDNLEHYYILSRYLISRMLTVTKVPQDKAVKIALDVKKWLVDNGTLDTSQGELEAVLFASMRARGFGDAYVRRYRVFNAFQHQKRPLVVMLCGAACAGKSALAQQLASRLNLPHVLQTDVLHELLGAQAGGQAGGGPRPPLWLRADLPQGLVSEFQQECRVMRRALDGDLLKCIQDGKSIILEGLHLDPGLYLHEFGQGGLLQRIAAQAAADAARRAAAAASSRGEAVRAAGGGGGGGGHLSYSSTPKQWVRNSSEGQRSAAIAAAATFMRRGPGAEQLSAAVAARDGDLPGGGSATTATAAATDSSSTARDAALGAGLLAHGGPVFVPIVLRVAPADHRIMAEPWLAAQLARWRPPGVGGGSEEATDGGRGAEELVMRRLLEVQEYLGGYGEVGVPVVPVDLLNFDATLDRLHDYVLSCVQLAMEQPGAQAGGTAAAAAPAGTTPILPPDPTPLSIFFEGV